MKDIKEMNLNELNDTLKKIELARGKIQKLNIQLDIQALSDKDITFYYCDTDGLQTYYEP